MLTVGVYAAYVLVVKIVEDSVADGIVAVTKAVDGVVFEEGGHNDFDLLRIRAVYDFIEETDSRTCKWLRRDI